MFGHLGCHDYHLRLHPDCTQHVSTIQEETSQCGGVVVPLYPVCDRHNADLTGVRLYL